MDVYGGVLLWAQVSRGKHESTWRKLLIPLPAAIGVSLTVPQISMYWEVKRQWDSAPIRHVVVKRDLGYLYRSKSSLTVTHLSVVRKRNENHMAVLGVHQADQQWKLQSQCWSPFHLTTGFSGDSLLLPYSQTKLNKNKAPFQKTFRQSEDK